LLVIALAGCGGGRVDAAGVRSNVASRILAAVDARGIPVEFDRVGCHGPDAQGTVTCYGTTTEEPSGDILGSFAGDRPGRSCPGMLTVTIDGTPLEQATFNPCR
jgi:hypothetical protein